MGNNYDNYRLQDLREHAQAIGVKSPTAKTKKELISAIEGVESGAVAPVFSKRGRPRYKKFNETVKGNQNNNDKEKVLMQKTIEKIQKHVNAIQDLLDNLNNGKNL